MGQGYYKLDTYQYRRSIGYLLRRCARLMAPQVESLFIEQDLSFAQWTVLMNLRDNPAMTGAELCQKMIHDSGALTRVIDQLEERGLVSRERSERDRREVKLQITPLGRRTTDACVPRVVEMFNGTLEDFNTKEVDQLLDLLTRLLAKLCAMPKPKEP